MRSQKEGGTLASSIKHVWCSLLLKIDTVFRVVELSIVIPFGNQAWQWKKSTVYIHLHPFTQVFPTYMQFRHFPTHLAQYSVHSHFWAPWYGWSTVSPGMLDQYLRFAIHISPRTGSWQMVQENPAKTLYVMVKTVVSCRFSLNSIHWLSSFSAALRLREVQAPGGGTNQWGAFHDAGTCRTPMVGT